MNATRAIIVTLLLSLLAGALGAWGGAEYVAARGQHPTPLHELLHHRLGLTAEQEKRIAVLESNYATIRKSSEAEMRAANAALAQAFHEDHAYTPKVQAAIDRFHHAMAELQKQTMIHIAAMRSVLTPAQAAQFDETIVKALTEDPS